MVVIDKSDIVDVLAPLTERYCAEGMLLCPGKVHDALKPVLQLYSGQADRREKIRPKVIAAAYEVMEELGFKQVRNGRYFQRADD
ncbi:hypothetical protein KY359_03390 [Candidatus Woesearchaeota archaeon]|nr:hypothetical protein [Candidatus Woesearchaeota archaeon]